MQLFKGDFMKYKTKETKSYDLHLITTNAFKTIFFKIVFWEPIKKEEITIRNLLVDNLIFSTSEFPSKKEMAIHKQDLYGAEIIGYNKRIGNYIYTEIYLSILNPRYTEDGIMKDSISFFRDVLYDPNVKNGAFDEEIFELIKNNNRDDIKRNKENADAQAFINLKNEVDSSSAFSYHLEGYLDDLDKITSKDLYAYYQKFLKSNHVDIFVVGNFDEEEMETVISDSFSFDVCKNNDVPICISYENGKRGIHEVVAPTSFHQSKLAVACSLENLSTYEKKYPLVLYNILLGNSPESKLFKNVREKLSAAYSINSSFRRYDNLLYITAGISYKNYDVVKEALEKEMHSLCDGNFSEEELTSAKQLYISVLKETLEYPSAITDYINSLGYLEADPIDEQIHLLEKVTKADVISVAKRVMIDTIYLLREKEK